MKRRVLTEEAARSKMLAGIISQKQYKTIIKENVESISVDDLIMKVKNSQYNIEDFEQEEVAVEKFINTTKNSPKIILYFFNSVKDHLPFTEGYAEEIGNIEVAYKIISEFYNFDVEIDFDITDRDSFIFELLDKYRSKIVNKDLLNKLISDTVIKHKTISSLFGFMKLNDDAILYILSNANKVINNIWADSNLDSNYEEYLQLLLEYSNYKSFSFMMDISNPFRYAEFKSFVDDYNLPPEIRDKYLSQYEEDGSSAEPSDDYDNWAV
jgi:hypothetical protein|tara:strand:+ start:20106 stop:20909 length:804 start_codon:yes stop_codon:yes gene_type:complete